MYCEGNTQKGMALSICHYFSSVPTETWGRLRGSSGVPDCDKNGDKDEAVDIARFTSTSSTDFDIKSTYH